MGGCSVAVLWQSRNNYHLAVHALREGKGLKSGTSLAELYPPHSCLAEFPGRLGIQPAA